MCRPVLSGIGDETAEASGQPVDGHGRCALLIAVRREGVLHKIRDPLLTVKNLYVAGRVISGPVEHRDVPGFRLV